MCRSKIDRAARVAMIGTLIAFAGCGWSELGERQSQNPKPPSSQPSTQPNGCIHVEFILLQHAEARPVAKKLAKFLKTESGFEHVTASCDTRTNRLIVIGAGGERMRAIKRCVAALDIP